MHSNKKLTIWCSLVMRGMILGFLNSFLAFVRHYCWRPFLTTHSNKWWSEGRSSITVCLKLVEHHKRNWMCQWFECIYFSFSGILFYAFIIMFVLFILWLVFISRTLKEFALVGYVPKQWWLLCDKGAEIRSRMHFRCCGMYKLASYIVVHTTF